MRILSGLLLFFMGLLLILSQASVSAACPQEDQEITVWRKQFPLILEADLYCSFFIPGKEPAARIIADGKAEERMLLREGDTVYIDLGTSSGVAVGQAFQMIDGGPKIGGFGSLFFKKGWLRVTRVMEEQSRAEIERLCGDAQIGTLLIPLVESEALPGKDMGFDVEFEDLNGADGKFLYFQQDYVQLSQGHWALIDLGTEDGISVGHQLAVYRLEKNTPSDVIANAIVIDARSRTATVKILSCRDVITQNDRIKGRI
jgi:hypothetical protein